LLLDISQLTKPEQDYMKYLEEKRQQTLPQKRKNLSLTGSTRALRALPKPEELENANC